MEEKIKSVTTKRRERGNFEAYIEIFSKIARQIGKRLLE